MTAATLQLRAQAELELRRRRGQLEAPAHWRDWLTELFPKLFSSFFAPYHAEFWRYVESIEPQIKPRPFFAIWARGGAKTTSSEAAVVRLAAKNVRKFCLYVRSTQDKANESVQNIAAMLESRHVARYYPQLADRATGKYGFAKGWRVDTLRCASGFSVIGLGFDAAVRGVKIEEARPDIIILDDIDDAKDSHAAVQKKVNTLTTSILPAGSPDVAIIGAQNLIHGDSIFTQLAEGTADFLHDRVVSGPYPAIENLEYVARPKGGYRITGGTPTWEARNIAICQKQLNEWGLSAFLREAQHEVEETGGIWDHIEFQHCDFADVPDLIRGSVWIDPAVTSTDESDSMGIIADGLGSNGKLYRLFAWEAITSPEDAMRRAILKAIELGFTTVGVETDQGGDTWMTVFNHVWDRLYQEKSLPKGSRKPNFHQAKAGAGHGSKVERNQRMLVDYERGNIIHVRGTHKVLERSLKRFPRKPLDLADVAFWGWHDLMGNTVQSMSYAQYRRENG